MSAGLNLQILLALAIIVVAFGAFGYVIWTKIAALGLLRDDFDRRAPWLALGVILGGFLAYYVRH